MADPVIPFDYYERLKRRGEQRQADPITATLQSMRAEDARKSIIDSPPPDQVARTTTVARAAGENPAMVEGSEDAYERAMQASAFGKLADRYPAVGVWSARNPRGAAAAADDTESLGFFGTAWDFLKKAPERVVKVGLPSLVGGVTKTWNTIEGAKDTVLSPLDAVLDMVDREAFGGALFDIEGTRNRQEQTRLRNAAYWDDMAAMGRRDVAGANPYSEGLLSGVDSIPQTLLAAVTRNPTLGASTIGVQVGASGYQDAKAKGVSTANAINYGIVQGATEVITERAPVGTLVDMIARKTPWGKAFVRELGQEMVGEQVATAVQDLADWAYLPENRGKTLGDYVAARPEAALQTGLAVVGGTGTTSAVIGAAQKASDATSKVTTQFADAKRARAEAAFLDTIERGATSSKLKGRDVEAFRDLMAHQAEDAGVESVFIPGEAIASYRQSESYDPFNDPFDGTDWQEAAASGGDVVMPVQDFLTDVVGSKAYAQIKDDVRLSQGGISTREADEFENGLDDLVAQAGAELAKQDRASQDVKAVRDKLVDQVTEKFGASFTAPTARTIAEIAVQRAQARAARLGMEMTGNEFDTLDVRQVLPEGVAQAVKADDLDLVVNALRTGKQADYGVGPSLLKFIKERGGVYDGDPDGEFKGGDLKAMGVPSRFIRKPKDGASGYGLDDTLKAAVEAGYFPELRGALDAAGPSTLDTNYLLEAIGRELSGGALFADERTDPIRAAADDLRQMLLSMDLDPDGMSDDEIRAVVNRVGPRSEEDGFEQTSGVIRSIIADAKLDPKSKAKADFLRVGDWLENAAREHGLDVSGMEHSIDASAVRHILKEHGDAKKEEKRGQIAITEQDFLDLPNTLAAADSIVFGTKANSGLDQIASVKTLPDGTILVIEEVRMGRNRLALKSMRKYPPTTSVENVISTLQPNARSDRGDTLDVVEVPPEGKQPLYQEVRGAFHLPSAFNQNQRIIELFQSRNLSTPLHELGHMWLEELRFDASLPEAPDSLKADWQTVQDWFAANGHTIDENGQIPVGAHELFARGIEAYLMEGKAPTPTLTRIFETVRGWMTSIYNTVKNLNAPITPEIRNVFDRMLATDEEIAAARERQGIAQLFTDAASIGMSEPEFQAYQAQADEARSASFAALLDKTMKAVRRRETERYQAARKTVLADETERLNNSPVFRALAMMKTQRMDKQWIIDRLGLDALDLLPKRVPPLYVDGGVNPDAIAEMTGHPSGRDMIEVLIGAERAHRLAKEGGDPRSMRVRVIESAVDEEMNRRYGDPLNDGSIEREALAAVHSDMQGEVIAAEVRVLGRKTGKAPTPYQAARDWARGKVRGGIISQEATPGAIQRYARNAAKAAKAAETAFLKQDLDEAYRQKQFQMLNNALLSEAKSAYDDVQAAVKRMDKIARAKTRKSVDQGYLDQAHTLLEAVDLRRRTGKYEERKGRFAAWAKAQEAAGYEVLVPDDYESTLGQTNWSKLTVESLLTLDETVKQIMHLGRLKQTLLDRQEEREWDAVIDEAVDGAGNLKGKPPADLAAPGAFEAIKRRAASMDAALLKMETVFDWLDGGNPDGVFNRMAFRPVAEAQAREQDMTADYLGRIKALFSAVPEATLARWQDVETPPFTDIHTGRPMRVNRQQLVAAALNIGNEGNLQRLADGYRIEPGALVAYLDQTLTAEEWTFVQGVWDEIDTLWPEIEALEKRVNGFAPEKVAPRQFTLSDGTAMRGGYYPAVYDTSRDYRAEQNSGSESDLFEGRYTKATTRSSSTKERAEKVKRPILLDLGVINRHLGEVIHDITHREPVIRANRFLTSERVRKAVDEALGPEIGKQLRPWIKHVANSWAAERAGNEGFGRFLTKLRANVTAVGMGLRATTMLTQVAGYSNSIEVVGEASLAKAIAAFSAHPIDTTRFVMERSGEMRHRMETIDRDIASEIARISARNPAEKGLRTAAEARKFFFHGIGYMDRLVSVPTWMAAYNNALVAGMTEQDAAYAADKAVRQSQGSGAAKDLAAISRGTGKYGEALKLMTMFYSYLSAMYQRERTLARDMSGEDTRRPRNLPKLASRAFFLFVVPTLLTEVMRAAAGADAGPDDEEWWAQWLMRKMLSNALGPIPLVRDVFEPTWNAAVGNRYFAPSISPINRALESVAKAAGALAKEARGDDAKHATKDVLEAVGYTTGLVPGQVASAVQFLVDVGAGGAEPETLGDWYQGIMTGKLED